MFIIIKMRLLLSYILSALLAILVMLPTAKADLPSHCLKWQVLGTWDFKLSQSQEEPALCGHTRPDDIVSVFLNNLGYENPGFTVSSTGTFKLLSNYSDEAELCLENNCEKAKWTMVYDEGMAIKGIQTGLELFVQFVYEPRGFVVREKSKTPDPKDPNKWKTFCDRTYPGWFGKGRNQRGCVVAKNRVPRPPQPSVSLLNDDGDNLIQMRSGLKMALQQSFKAEFMSQRTLNFDNLDEEVSLINKRQKFWVADASAASFAMGFTNKQTLSLFGGDREKLLKPKSYSLDNIIDPAERAKESARRSCIRKVLPNSWDWATHEIGQTPVINQGNCGSCYAVSSLDAFTSRLRIKKNSTAFAARSSRAVLQCSPTNQGCDGGFPWLVAHHAHYEGLYSETCAGPYTIGNPSPGSQLAECRFTTSECTADREFAKDWGYVGGHYGRGNTEDMMWSLFRDGPLVVAINARSDLFMYRSGLFIANPPGAGDEVKVNEAYWEATTHAVTLVGWGSNQVEGHDVESWKIKNSWGENWGERGYFHIQRGVDAMAVESMPVHAIFGEGKPGNPEFEAYVNNRLKELQDETCSDLIGKMLQKELV